MCYLYKECILGTASMDDRDFLRNSNFQGIHLHSEFEKLACNYSSLDCCLRPSLMVLLERYMAGDNLPGIIGEKDSIKHITLVGVRRWLGSIAGKLFVACTQRWKSVMGWTGVLGPRAHDHLREKMI